MLNRHQNRHETTRREGEAALPGINVSLIGHKPGGEGLVRSRKEGRVRTYRLAPGPLKRAEQWLVRQRAHWERRLDQFDSYLERLQEKRP